jgi:HD-like signal output (HDOD) protein
MPTMKVTTIPQRAGRTMIDLGPEMTDLIARRGVSIPPAPTTAIRMRRLVESANYSQADLVAVVASDQTLTVALLQAANQLAPKGAPITSVEHAVRKLGAVQMGQMALAFSTASSVQPDGPLAPLRFLAWRRALMGGFLCRFLAEQRALPAADAFACGLLHDFGWIVALACLERLLEQHPGEGKRPESAWQELVDQFHILLGHMAATSWGLPPTICDAILYHHDPIEAPPATRAMVELVAVSDGLVALLEQHSSVEESDVQKLPGFGDGHAEALIAALPEMALQVSELFALLPSSEEMTPSKVLAPARSLRGRMVRVHWAASFVTGATFTKATVIGIAAEGLILITARPPRENYISKIVVTSAEGRLDLCVTPVVVTPEGEEHRVEARLYGLGGAALRAWDRLYAATAAATPTS